MPRWLTLSKAALKSICTIRASCPLSNALCTVWDTHRSASGTQTFPISKLGGWQHTTVFHKSSKANRYQTLKHHRQYWGGVVISRLRLGHTFLTHSYLMNNDVPDTAPICELCNNAVMTVKHIMIQCVQLLNVKYNYLRLWRPGWVSNMRELLGWNVRASEVLSFLRSIAAYDLVWIGCV